jgi:hypothetical protein
MTVRTWFRQLRAQQWALDDAFFSRMHAIYPNNREPVTISICHAGDPEDAPLRPETLIALAVMADQHRQQTEHLPVLSAYRKFVREVTGRRHTNSPGFLAMYRDLYERAPDETPAVRIAPIEIPEWLQVPHD